MSSQENIPDHLVRQSRPVRWWPAVVIVVAATARLAWISPRDASDRQDQFLQMGSTAVVGALLLLIWLTAFSRLPGRHRLAIVGAVVGGGLLAGLLLRIEGVSGNLVPVFTWRFGGERVFAERTTASEAVASPDDYPQFLGPRRDGTVTSTVRLARDWRTTPPRELWRHPIGQAWSSFAVVGDAAVTQEQRGELEMVVRYELATGKEVWAHGDPTRHATGVAGVGPRATPTVIGGRVYTLGANGLLNALDLADGTRLWSREILEDNDADLPEWGKSCSPLVHGDLVVVSAGGTEGRSLVAYHKDSGEIVWRNGDDFSSYSSPIFTELDGLPQIVILNAASVAAHAVDDGRLLWSHSWVTNKPNVAPPLLFGDDTILVSSGYGVGAARIAIRRDHGGGFTTEELWRSPRLKAKFANMVLHEGYVYGLDDGILTCLDPANGERRWKSGRYGHGQLILTSDLLLIQAEKGDVMLVEARPDEHHELARLAALSGKAWNPPVLNGRFLLLRNHREAVYYELPTEG